MPVKTNIIGGYGAYVSGLGVLDLENPEQNHAMYTKWAGSVKDFPQVIKQKVCLSKNVSKTANLFPNIQLKDKVLISI